MKTRKPSPCLTCNRVQDPGSCENKRCSPWRLWFLDRWAQLQTQYAQTGIFPPVNPTDPCNGCAFPQAPCDAPCRRKQAWQTAREVTQ